MMLAIMYRGAVNEGIENESDFLREMVFRRGGLGERPAGLMSNHPIAVTRPAC